MEPKKAQEIYDLVVVGAGGGGMCLLLAMHQNKTLYQKKILVIEPAVKHSHDRTWCFWAEPNDPVLAVLEDIPHTRWDEALLADKQRSLAPFSYYEVRSGHFYESVQEKCKQAPNCTWLKSAAQYVKKQASGRFEVMAEGQIYLASQICDSRPQTREVEFWQSFAGMRIQTKEPHNWPLQLMNFDDCPPNNCHFWYVLPTSTTEALVEITQFDSGLLDRDAGLELIHAKLTSEGVNYELIDTEYGQLPMWLENSPELLWSDGIKLGITGGVIRSSTGFAFARMYRHATNVAKALAAGTELPVFSQHKRHRFYDGILLHLLKQSPGLGRLIFNRLYSRVRPAALFRFLDEKSNLKEELQVIAALPWGPFLKTVWANSSKSRLLVVSLLLISLLIQAFAPALLQQIMPWMLLAGLLFPGIPHGAVDHLLSRKQQALPVFIGQYLLIMVLVVALWWWQPWLGLLSFLAYSAWHFGQTDFEHWQLRLPFVSTLYGWSVLGWILASHPAEWMYYLQALGLPYWEPPATGIMALSLFIFLWSAVQIPPRARTSYLGSMAILAAGSFLPLLLAFGFYFLGLHSRRGWLHLQKGLQLSSTSLLMKALPFSAAAWLLFVVLGVAGYVLPLNFDGWIPGFFVFLAAVSAPHVVKMSGFYSRKAPFN